MQLRPWQTEAVQKALSWLLSDSGDRHFLINAAPGSGKTIASCVIARELFQRGEISRAIIIAPRREVVRQWADDYKAITGRHMTRITAASGEIALDLDVCATWAAVCELEQAFQAVCQNHRTLIVCDEHHHAAVKAAWGESADSAFREAA